MGCSSVWFGPRRGARRNWCAVVAALLASGWCGCSTTQAPTPPGAPTPDASVETPASCRWDPGFGLEGCDVSGQRLELSLRDPSVTALQVTVAGPTGLHALALPARVELDGGVVRFSGAAEPPPAAGTLMRAAATRPTRKGHLVATSGWFAYRVAAPTVDCALACAPTCAGSACGAPDGCGGTCPCAPDASCDGGPCACVPACGARECGGDGCGGSCGACAPGLSCVDGRCACVPSCAPKACGTPDGCGGVCGPCAPGLTCIQRQCTCVPSCAGKACGSDGCGGSCGACGAGFTCASGACSCTPSCARGACGVPDGCGGTCGPCGTGLTCVAGTCACAPTCGTRQCGSDGCGGSCGTCAAGSTCSNGACSCTRSCAPGACGTPDGCGGTCGPCAAGLTCVAGECACAPVCGGKQCGADGCGGSCGACAQGSSCASGTCVSGCTAPWNPQWSQELRSGEWWVEYQVAGGGVLTTAVTVEKVSTGALYPLQFANGHWTGGVDNLTSGSTVVMHATNALGATAQTVPFRSLVDTAPLTDACQGTPQTSSTCQPLSTGLLTFALDDSSASQASIAVPLLQQYGAKATFYTVPPWLGWVPLAKTLAAAGHEFAAHTWTHPVLTQLSPQQVDDELRQGKDWLEANLNSPVTDFATPSGAYNDAVLAQVKTSYASHRTTSDNGLNFVGSDRYRLQTVLIEASTTAPPICARIAQAAAQKGWLILTFHDFTNDATTTASFTCPAVVFRAILSCATTTPGLRIVTVKQAVDAIRCGGP